MHSLEEDVSAATVELPALPEGSRVLVAGCGFVGVEVARRLHRLGWQVTGATHTQSSAEALAGEPFRVVACDINDRAALAALAAEAGGFQAVVDAVSSGRGGPEAYRIAYLQGVQSLLETLRPERFIFVSSTSVYAQVDGALVDENSPAEPERETGRILRETEELVLKQGGQVARLGGIYAPERWVLWRKFRDGEAIVEGDGGRFINQIHRDDAASALVFLLTEVAQSGIFNVTDGSWPTQREVYEAFARVTGKALPPFGPVDPNRKRGWTHKRVSTAKLRGLGWQPKYKSVAQVIPLARALDRPKRP